jgi:hypothetical protein
MSLRPSLLTVRRRGINACGRVPGLIGVVKPVGRKPRYDQLVSEIVKFLYTDKGIAKIDFHLGISENRIHITGAKIAKIGTRLQAGEFTLEVVDAKVRKGPPAEYIRKGKERKFLFRFSITFSEEEIEENPSLPVFRNETLVCGVVVHEFVHAVLDEGRAIVRLSDEAAAYLAETLYHVCGDPPTYDTYLKYATGEQARQIIKTARELITEHRLDSEPGRHLNWLQYRALRKVIHAHPDYRHLGPIERWD